MDKGNQLQNSKGNLPNTPRVCGKIMEYYQKYGQERDIEKFMRLYSPEYCISTKEPICKRTKSPETVSSKNSSQILVMMPPRPLKACCEANSKSLPNIDIQGQVFVKYSYTASDDVTVDINIEADGEKEKVLSISTENLKTPKKSFRSAKTQTPESVAKTHRRLEWDSLGDVGYKKSMSASNISNTERSLLREFFKESSVVSEPSPATRKEEIIFEDKQIKAIDKFKVPDKEHSTPPLACSTLVNPTVNEAKTKTLSHWTTSTSLLTEKFEKYAQTSIIKPPSVRSQEVQCNLSSSYSVAEGTATPSSFEYYSSRSSNSKSSRSSDNILNANNQNQLPIQQHPFITSITDMLMKRKVLGEKTPEKRHQLNNIKDLQTKFQAALDENKENHSNTTVDNSPATSFSLSKQAPELDLGIQLICALIDAKSINGRQKKHLIRDIIKRLTRIEGEEKSEISTTVNSSEGTDNRSVEDTTTNSSNVCNSHPPANRKHQQRNVIKSVELGVSALKTEQMNTKEKSTTSSTYTSEDGCDAFAAKQFKNQPMSRPLKNQDKASGHKQFPVIKTRTQKNVELAITAATAKQINKETQSELITMDENKRIEANCKSTAKVLATNILKSNRCTQTSKTSSASASASASTGSTTPELITQKLNTNAKPEQSNNHSNNTKAGQPTMREWLNPLTQSEIEYEEKKQMEIRKKSAAQQEKLTKNIKHDCGRVQQLSWIENEIKRLECLKHLLLKDETATKSSSSISSIADNSLFKKSSKNSYQTDKLYDTVYTEKSSVLSESAEQLVKEIEIILEESHEDVINFKDNIKHSKQRTKETQIIYEKERNSLQKTNAKNPNTHEQNVLDSKMEKQRKKLDTPSTDISKESDNLQDMVQQRKREFMEAYKSKKQHHHDALKQQQKEGFKYLNVPQKLITKSATDSEHYSVPHTMPRKYISNDVSYYTQHPSSITPIEIAAVHNHARQSQSSKPLTIIPKSVNVNHSTTNSSSSMFCMSSEISLPMGSQNVSSSPPSDTHQFNGKTMTAATTGVAVQTSDSLRLSKPIYGPPPLQRPTSVSQNPATSTSTACIQVKPKAIAYVIEFDDNKRAVSNPPSAAHESNSDDLLTKPNAKSNTSNTKSSSTDEQQLTLQEHLEKRKPKFLKHSKERKAILNQLQCMRQERVRQLREIIENTSINSLDRRLQYLPPPPIQKVRILRTKDMKALTYKRFASLPEVVAKQERENELKKRRSNRILRDVFNKRLQKRVRSGKLSLNHSKTVV